MANVVRCNSTGCTMPQNVESTIMTPVMGLALAPPNGYFSGGDCIDVCNLGTLSCTPKIACNGGQANIVQSLAADNKDLFWSIGGQLKRCTLPCTNNAIPAGTAQMASVVAMDGNFFYWGDFSAGTISKLPR
jgi:hypothetical protein